jgi:hypothetical protein
MLSKEQQFGWWGAQSHFIQPFAGESVFHQTAEISRDGMARMLKQCH